MISQEIRRHRRRKQAAFLALQYMSFIEYYAYRFLSKTPERTSLLTGNQYVAELLDGNPRRFERVGRMSKVAFDQLCTRMRRYNLLWDTRKGITVERYY